MTWGYLGTFWDAVQEVVVGGATYTVDWFQSIGNAVAGAVGALFDFIIHGLTDWLILLGWFGQLLSDIFQAILTPLNFVFVFFKAFFATLFSPAIAPPFTIPGAEYLAIVPAIGAITGVLAVCLILYLTFATIKHLTHI